MAFSNNKRPGGKADFSHSKDKTGIDLAGSPALQKLNVEQAWEKVKPYCAYQERCHSEVKEKLYGYGLHRQEVEQLLSRLIEENFLNEERFAILYAGGHSRIKKWGKIKIAHALRQKGISAYCIRKSLQEINTSEYLAILQRLAVQKWETLRKQPVMVRKHKCSQYLIQKGYETSLINEVLKQQETKSNN